MHSEKLLSLESFPSPDEIWRRYSKWKNIDSRSEQIIEQDYYYDPGRKPRYYQQVAINKSVEAIANGQNRILLIMATGTGKTYTAFQIIWKLWKTGIKKRILFLADRNILVEESNTAISFQRGGEVMRSIIV